MPWPTRRKQEAGFTLLELIISTCVLVTVAFWASSMISRPAVVQNMLLNVDRQQQANRVANQFVSDLQEADPSTILWNTIPPNDMSSLTTISFSKRRYDLNNPTIPTPIPVQYEFQPDSGAKGSIVRTVNGASQTVLRDVLPPSADAPLVQQDVSAYNMLIVRFSYQPAAMAQPISILRRVAISG